MSWLYLVLAGLFEIGWPLGLKLAQDTEPRLTWLTVAVVSMGLSGTLLWLAPKEIALGTAYAVWTGIGAAGTLFFRIA